MSLGRRRVLTGGRVLVVEDDPDIRGQLCDALAEEGYVVEQARHGAQALAWLAHHGAPALVVLDLMMPVMDGQTLLGAMRADPRLAEVPVIVMTADHRSPPPESAIAFLKKPFDLTELLALVDRHARRDR